MRQVAGDLTTFAVYVAKILFIVAGIPLLVLFALGTLNSITVNDVFSAKGGYWLIVAAIAYLCFAYKKFYYAFLILLPFFVLFLYFGGIDYLHAWLY